MSHKVPYQVGFHDQSGAIETAQVIEELIEMATKVHAAANRGEELGLSEDEIHLYDAPADNESAVRELTDEPLKKIAQELTENLRKNLSMAPSERESVRAKLRLMVKRILRKYKYPPDLQEGPVELALFVKEDVTALQIAVAVFVGLSGAGLSQTTPGLDQSLVGPRQRSGRAALAC